VSIVRSKPSELQTSKVDTVELTFETKEDGKQNVTGCQIWYTKTKGTKYVLKNNSFDRTVSKFYIDHVADSSHGGFVIVTQENCSKSVTGFSRFEFSLNPQQEIAFIVLERANFSESISSTSELINFIIRRSPSLVSSNVLKKEDLLVLKQLVRKSEVVTALRSVENEHFTGRDVQQWRVGSSVDLESGGLIPADLAAKLDKVLDLKAKLSEVCRLITAGNERIQVVFKNQGRLRENLKSLEKMTGSELVKRYLTDLDKEEDDLEKTRTNIEKNENTKAVLETQIKDELHRAALEAKKKREEIEAS